MSDTAQRRDDPARGTALLPQDLTDDELTSVPTLASVDALLIEDLTDAEDEAFAAALES